jgi:hypothetical protein
MHVAVQTNGLHLVQRSWRSTALHCSAGLPRHQQASQDSAEAWRSAWQPSPGLPRLALQAPMPGPHQSTADSCRPRRSSLHTAHVYWAMSCEELLEAATPHFNARYSQPGHGSR